MKYRAEIDGLRAVAVVPVILFHAGFEVFGGGYIGVDVFFVISGYLITSIILTEMNEGRFSLLNFYERRARRILPALFFVVLCCLPVAWFTLFPTDMKDFAQSLIAVATFSSNFLFWSESGYFDTAAEIKPLLHTWSLAVEEQYYIIFPVFLMLAWRWGTGRIVKILIGVFVFSLLLAHWAAYQEPEAGFFLLPARAWELLAGAFIAFYVDKRTVAVRPALANALSALGLVAIAFAIFAYDSGTPFPSFYAVVPVAGVVAVILFAVPGTLAHRLLSWRPMVAIGLVSYSAYLWHQPILAFYGHTMGHNAPLWHTGLMLLATALLSVFSYRYVETPTRHRKVFGSRPTIWGFAVTSSVAVIALGVMGAASNGNVFRYPQGVVDLFDRNDEFSRIVWQAKDATRLQDFDPDAETKLLLIGDSNSADLQNALNAVIAPGVSVVSAQVGATCGNLFLPREKFAEFLREDRFNMCAPQHNDLSDPKTDKLIAQADVVILATAWTEWEADLMQDSHARLVDKYGEKFWVFGTKSVEFDRPEILNACLDDCMAWQTTPHETAVEVNAKLTEALGDRFIDPLEMICAAPGCTTFLGPETIVMYDGFHLTPEGSVWLGEQLKANGYLAKMGLGG
ncbi:acyltransferase [Roseovarius gahaiensis]|uniref:Acyltransferase n=1 Tax=Roseovarius gahaiensis TaxID=2716691 RepID=A0A967BDC1_9RHOB|nr:acyltransferase [Roseovarius gahaiensis]